MFPIFLLKIQTALYDLCYHADFKLYHALYDIPVQSSDYLT